LTQPDVCENCGDQSSTRLWLTKEGQYLCSTCSTKLGEKPVPLHPSEFDDPSCVCFVVFGILWILTYSTSYIWLSIGWWGLVIPIILLIGTVAFVIEWGIRRRKGKKRATKLL
jgi:hypothetical protein